MSDPVRLRHRFGALALETGGVQYRLWAPGREAVAVLVSRTDGSHETLPLNREAEDFFVTEDRAGEGGDLYRWQVDGEGPFPDPASHFQPDGVHGSSEVVAHESFRWRHSRRLIQPREAVIYEMHIGTFTREGTFESAAARLPELQALGITAVELMPVADFPGERNWGYDGVMLFAPARSYGRPEDFKRFVDVAHGLGLAVILDVVYNHFGPDGNYLWALAGKGFFRKDRKTPWGDAINYDGAEGRPVRDFFLENLAHWMGHYRIDGFRFDATQEIRDESERHLLAELASLVHAHDGWIVAEDDRNEHRLCLSESRGGIGLDAVWADDFHHVVRVALTGQRESYYGNYEGTATELATVLDGGWLYQGQRRLTTGEPRGTDPAPLDPTQFVHCISNHDQTGNRAHGERLHHLVSPETARVAQALLLLGPFTPMLFMGDEWACSTPFLFFTDHAEPLGSQVTAGRRREFAQFKAFADPASRKAIPDPQLPDTFQRSQLDWQEREQPPHAAALEKTRELLTLRKTLLSSLPRQRGEWRAEKVGADVVRLVYSAAENGEVEIWCALSGGGSLPAPQGAVLLLDGLVQFHEEPGESRQLIYNGPFILLLKLRPTNASESNDA